MKYYLEKSSNSDLLSVVIRGKDSSGKAYRLFVKLDGKVVRVDPKQWIKKGDKDFDREKFVRKNPVLNSFLRDLKRLLEDKVTASKITSPSYSIPDAWDDLYGTPKATEAKLPEKIVEAIEPYLIDNRGHKSARYLRHYDQLKNELTAWNKDICFSNLNEIALNSYLQYLKGQGTPVRKPLMSSTIGHHFKHLRQVSKYASKRGIQVDPMVYDFTPGRVTYELGCFDLTFEELMALWFYTPANRIEEVVLDHSLFEAFTGIRTGDIYSLKSDGLEHGIKCGDVGQKSISYRDRKNDDLIKTVTRHKFNERLIEKYLQTDSNAFLLPPLIQQTSNRVIKEIARKAGLNRPIRRGNDIRPIHEAVSSHCFRASYGNLLYRIGITPELVSEELGHAAATVTIRHYLKFSNRHELIRDKMNQLKITSPDDTRLKLAI
jgi:site-specific recombinase XerD